MRLLLLLAMLLPAPALGSWCWVGPAAPPAAATPPGYELTQPCPQLSAAWAGHDLTIRARVIGVAQTPGAQRETVFLNLLDSRAEPVPGQWQWWQVVEVGEPVTVTRRTRGVWWACERHCIVVLARGHEVVWTAIAGPPPCDAFPLSVELHGIVDGVQVVEACRWVSFDGTVAATGNLTLRAPEVRLLSGARVLTGGRLEVGR